jgi:hypothetical protein
MAFVTTQALGCSKQLWRFVTSRGCMYVSNQWYHHEDTIVRPYIQCAYPSICDGEVLDAILLYEKTGERPDNSRMHDKEKKDTKNRHNERVARQKARVTRKRVKKRVRQANKRPFHSRSETDKRLRRFLFTYQWPGRSRRRQTERLLRAHTKQQRKLARHVVVALEDLLPNRDIVDIVISYTRD